MPLRSFVFCCVVSHREHQGLACEIGVSEYLGERLRKTYSYLFFYQRNYQLSNNRKI